MRHGRRFIETINITKLHRGDWFTFIKEYFNAVRELGAETLNFLQVWQTFYNLYQEMDIIMRPVVKSMLTPELKALDEKRDKMFRQMKRVVKGYVNNYETAKDVAARKLMVVFDTYDRLLEEDRQGETGDIYNFVQEMKTKHTADLTTLGISQWVNEIDKANKEFDNKWIERNDEETLDKPQRKFEEVAKEINYYYDVMMWNLEWQMLGTPNETIKRFVEKWNGIIEWYKELLNRQEGIRKEDEEEIL